MEDKNKSGLGNISGVTPLTNEEAQNTQGGKGSSIVTDNSATNMGCGNITPQ